jgi:Flp pilus assembly protein TadG
MIAPRRSGVTKCASASVAVEFALLLPALGMLVVGGMSAGILTYSASSLQNAVEQAARCYSVNVSQCNNASAVQAYARNNYYGMSTPAFTATIAPCGHQVSATVTFVLNAAVASWNVPLTATACFP